MITGIVDDDHSFIDSLIEFCIKLSSTIPVSPRFPILAIQKNVDASFNTEFDGGKRMRTTSGIDSNNLGSNFFSFIVAASKAPYDLSHSQSVRACCEVGFTGH